MQKVSLSQGDTGSELMDLRKERKIYAYTIEFSVMRELLKWSGNNGASLWALDHFYRQWEPWQVLEEGTDFMSSPRSRSLSGADTQRR